MNAPVVFYKNYFDILNPTVIRTNFLFDNRNQTVVNLTLAFDESLSWPYNMTYNCYWGLATLYDKFNGFTYPNVLNYRNLDGSFVKYDMYGQFGMNLLMNFGYITADIMWLLVTWDNIADWWFKTGNVAGDIYMRLFFRVDPSEIKVK